MMQRILARLLHLANTSPPAVYRAGFYGIKDRLLRRHGKLIGHEWQHIVHHCWRCEEYGFSRHCRRCGGTGVYQQFWVQLERWAWRGYLFHRPCARVWQKPEESVAIDGYVKHASYGRKAQEANLWLAMLCDRSLFWKLLTGSCACGWTWWPLLNLQKLVFQTRMLFGRFHLGPCSECGGWTFRMHPRFVYRSWVQCRRCERAERCVPVDVGEDLPF
jgi:hypothetical protein